MDITTFEDLIDRNGGDLARWPAADREASAGFLAASPTARARLEEMQLVETALCATSAARRVGASDRIVARAMRAAQETRPRRVVVRAGIGAAAAAVLLLGVLLGGASTTPATHDTGADRIVAMAFGSSGVGDVE